MSQREKIKIMEKIEGGFVRDRESWNSRAKCVSFHVTKGFGASVCVLIEQIKLVSSISNKISTRANSDLWNKNYCKLLFFKLTLSVSKKKKKNYPKARPNNHFQEILLYCVLAFVFTWPWERQRTIKCWLPYTTRTDTDTGTELF